MNSIRTITRAELLSLWNSIDHRLRSAHAVSDRQSRLRLDGEYPELAGSRLRAVWAENDFAGTNLPTCIILDEEAREEFLAWAAVYLDSGRPISSILHVLTEQEWERWDSRGRATSNVDVAVSSLIGASLGDAFASPRTPPDHASALDRAFASATFVTARSMVLYPDWSPEEVLTRWAATHLSRANLARTMTGALALTNVARTIAGLDSGLANSSQERVLASMADVVRSDPDAHSAVSLVRAFSTDLAAAVGDLDSPREARVSAWRRTAAGFQGSRTLGLSESFAIALSLDTIAPGSMEYASLLRETLPDNPVALHCYGFCAALRARNGVYRQFGGVGYMLARELERLEPSGSRPVGDISVSELQVLRRGKHSLARRGVVPTDRTLVELAPGVRTLLSAERRLEESGTSGTAPASEDPFAQLEARLRESLELVRAMRPGQGYSTRRRRT